MLTNVIDLLPSNPPQTVHVSSLTNPQLSKLDETENLWCSPNDLTVSVLDEQHTKPNREIQAMHGTVTLFHHVLLLYGLYYFY